MHATNLSWGVIIALSLSGCVLVLDPAPTSPNTTERSVRQHVDVSLHPLGDYVIEDTIEDHSPSPPPPPTTKAPTTDCPVFQLPPPRSMPVIADLADESITTQEEIETILVEHIQALSSHITDERTRLVTRHQRYLEACRT